MKQHLIFSRCWFLTWTSLVMELRRRWRQMGSWTYPAPCLSPSPIVRWTWNAEYCRCTATALIFYSYSQSFLRQITHATSVRGRIISASSGWLRWLVLFSCYCAYIVGHSLYYFLKYSKWPNKLHGVRTNHTLRDDFLRCHHYYNIPVLRRCCWLHTVSKQKRWRQRTRIVEVANYCFDRFKTRKWRTRGSPTRNSFYASRGGHESSSCRYTAAFVSIKGNDA